MFFLFFFFYNQEAEIAIGPFRVSDEIMKTVDFITTFHLESSALLFKRPDSYQSFYIIKPFKTEVWICIIGFIGLSTIILFFFSRFEYQESNFKFNSTININTLHSFRFYLWYALGSAINQGGKILNHRKPWVKIIISCIWITNVIVLAVFFGNLTAFLGVKNFKLPIKSLEEGIENDNFHLITFKESEYTLLFNFSKLDLFKRTWEKISKDTKRYVLPDLPSAISVLKSHNYGFINDRSLLNFFMNNDCSLVSTPKKYDFSYFPISFMVQKDWPYQRILGKAMLEVALESGLKIPYFKRYNIVEKPNLCKEKKSISSIGMDMILPAIYFLISGICFSIFIFIMERLTKVTLQRNNAIYPKRDEDD